jgi:hypothetical protein
MNGSRMQQVSDAVGFCFRQYFNLALGHEI